MEFKLSFPVPPLSNLVNIRKPMLLLGSCFAEEVGEKLRHYRFDVAVNPHGILFNPLSLFRALERYADNYQYTEKDLFKSGDLWYSYEHHGRFASADRDEALRRINHFITEGSHFLRTAGTLVITFGSTWVYRLKQEDQVVANCHKMPQTLFDKSLLSVSEIVSAFDTIHTKLMNINPGLQVLFTVSPVRYVRDGLHENNLSKATLLLAVNELVRKYNSAQYFPAYEIVTDELRDYRFYARDMVHPNTQAVDYVWERFRESCLDKETQTILDELEPLLVASAHRPLHPATEEYWNFTSGLERKKADFQKKYPFIKWDEQSYLP